MINFSGKKEGEEDDLMAELDANLANIIEKDKKKGSKDSGSDSNKTENSSEPTAEQKANPNLLKPTDIPATVMEEKKNLINSRRNSKDAENKTETSVEGSATPAESTESASNNEPKKPETKQEVAPEAPKSPKKSALKNANTTPATPEPPKSPKKGGANSGTTPDISKEIQGSKIASPSILKSPVHSNKKVKKPLMIFLKCTTLQLGPTLLNPKYVLHFTNFTGR